MKWTEFKCEKRRLIKISDVLKRSIHTACWHNAFCWRYALTQIRPPPPPPPPPIHRLVDLVFAGLKCHKVVSVGKDSYINEQCGQPGLNAAWSRSKILALHQTELRMPNLWTAIIVFSNISFFEKKSVLWFRIWKRNLLQKLSVINSNPFIRSLFRRICPFVYMCKSDQNARCSLVQDGVHSISWLGHWYKTL